MDCICLEGKLGNIVNARRDKRNRFITPLAHVYDALNIDLNAHDLAQRPASSLAETVNSQPCPLNGFFQPYVTIEIPSTGNMSHLPPILRVSLMQS
jgi:hypothetical protein